MVIPMHEDRTGETGRDRDTGPPVPRNLGGTEEAVILKMGSFD